MANPRITILLIEDNPSSRKILRLTLEAENYSVVEAPDGVAALEYLTNERPDLIIQDLVLPDIGGIELTRRIRMLSNGREVPIIVVSGFVGRIEEVRSIRDQYIDVLVKPVLPTKLVDTVRAHLAPSAARYRPTDHGHHVLLVDDSPTQLKLDRLRFEHMHFTVSTSDSGEAALELMRGGTTPHVVVTDVLMSGMDGFELCHRLRLDPELGRIPVVLVSSHQEDQDIFHAKEAGASAFLQRGPASHDLIDAAFEAVATGAPAVPNLKLEIGQGQHAQRLIQRLERHVVTRTNLEQRCAVQAAELALLGGVADALTRSADAEATLKDIFAASLDAAGISSGALFLIGDDGALTLRQSIGYDDTHHVDDFFGAKAMLAKAVADLIPVSVPSLFVPGTVTRFLLSNAKCASMQIVPLVLGDKGVGALVLGSRATDLPSDGVVAFARAIGTQIVHSLALMRAFEARREAEHALHLVNESLERRVAARTADLERTTRLRADMLAFVSHDLRNPLSTIRLGTEQLSGNLALFQNAAAAERLLGRISRASLQMQNLIGGLLDFASIEAGTFSVERQSVLVRAVVEEVLEMQAAIAKAKSIDVEMLDSNDGWIQCDPERVGQVLANLIGNAIKFTKPGGKIALSIKKVNGLCEISVMDSGCGIESEHLEHVFDRYWQVPNTKRRGTGLGLAIAKGIVQAHGGELSVTSTVGTGSQFRFTLGRMSDIQPTPPHSRIVASAIDLEARKILIVDDDPELRQSIAEFLAAEGFMVLEASDGASALLVLDAETPDLILLDQQMPHMSGDEFMVARESRVSARQIPVVMLSASLETLLPGSVALVRKPFTSAGLLDVVNRHCTARPVA